MVNGKEMGKDSRLCPYKPNKKFELKSLYRLKFQCVNGTEDLFGKPFGPFWEIVDVRKDSMLPKH